MSVPCANKNLAFSDNRTVVNWKYFWDIFLFKAGTKLLTTILFSVFLSKPKPVSKSGLRLKVKLWFFFCEKIPQFNIIVLKFTGIYCLSQFEPPPHLVMEFFYSTHSSLSKPVLFAYSQKNVIIEIILWMVLLNLKF